MKVLLINEPFVADFCRTQRWAARTRGRVLRAPDWLAYATAVLERDGFEAKLYDFPARNWGRGEFVDLLKKEKPQAVVLDSTTPSIDSDLDYAGWVKEQVGAQVIMVGPHASALPEETLARAHGRVDVIAIGEYEETVRDLLRNPRRPAEVPGVCYWDGERAVRSAPRPLIEPLDRLPFPAWHQLNLLDYFDGTKLHPYLDIFSGRGCPHRCSFCLWPQVMHGQRYRLRSPQRVVDEIEYDIALCPEVQKGGEFFFEDDTFTVLKSHALAICEEILRRDLAIRFSVNARADAHDLEMLKLMKRAGCRLLLVGFESGAPSILQQVEKKATLEDARRLMANAKAAGLDVHGCFVLGLPGETAKTMEETVRFALELGLATAQFSAAVPFPGTRYFAWCEDNHLLRSRNWSDWLRRGEQASVVDYPGLGREAVDRAVDRALARFYFRPAYMARFLLNTRSRSDLYRKLRGLSNFLSYWRQR